MKNSPKKENVEKIVDLMILSSSLRHENRHEEALECLDRALKIDADFLPLFVEKGIVLGELDRYEESLKSLDRYLKTFPNALEVRRLRRNILQDALSSCDKMLEANPADTKALLRRGDIFMQLHRYSDALDTYDLTLRIETGSENILNRRGNALFELNRFEDALESYDRALETAPHNARILFNRGRVLQELSRTREAVESFSDALACGPYLAEAAVELSHCHLSMGDFREGWQQYESRWETEQLKLHKLDSPKPLWLGKEDIAGKTTLLWAEQGFGDTIQFLRYVPFVERIAGLVILRVPLPLKRLSRTLKSPVLTVTHEEKLPHHDFHCPLMSLPLVFSTTMESIPADIPYLSASGCDIEKWRKILGPSGKLRVGIAWAGRRQEPVNGTRDMQLETLRRLTFLDAEIISLQKEVPEEDKTLLDSIPRIRTLSESPVDFADTAALIETLDLVISVDTAVAHLAGALGKPVWLMLRHSGEWRWLQGRSDSPWYPSMRIFRQKSSGDWTGVVHEITRQLQLVLKSSL